MHRRPPGSTLDRSSAASDVYKRQAHNLTMQISFVALDPVMGALLEQRALANQQMVQVGDVFTVVIAAESFIGTEDGLGGYMDFLSLIHISEPTRPY